MLEIMRMLNENEIYAWPNNFVVLDRAAIFLNKMDLNGDSLVDQDELAKGISYKGF